MLQSMHSQLFVVLLYPPAGSGCCRISCRYSLVLQKMPGIDGAGSQYKTNRRAPAVAGYPTSSPRCTGKLCQPAGVGRCRFARKLYICRINTRIYGCHIEPCTQYAGSSLYAGFTWSSGIRHKLVPVGIISVLYTTIVWQQNLDCPQIAKRSMMDDERSMMDDERQMMDDEWSFATRQRPALPHYKHSVCDINFIVLSS